MRADERIMAAINPNMRLTRDLFRDVYAVGMSDPDFPDKAIKALEETGCSKARQYYDDWVAQYEAEQKAMLKEVAHWYAEECRKETRKREREVMASRWKQEAGWTMEDLHQMSDRRLLSLLRSLRAESLGQ